MGDYYILDGKIPVPVTDLSEWARWLENNNSQRIVKQETVGPYFVSTVFLGLDHRWINDDPPLLFETMIFTGTGEGRNPKSEDYQERYSTWELAVEGHERTVQHARKLAEGQ